MEEEKLPAGPTRTVSPYNAANLLTVLRLVLVPVFLGLAVSSGLTGTPAHFAACLVFMAASATDFADGWIARRWSLITPFGQLADPIADKALTGTAFVLLSAFDRLPWWVTLLILTREWGVTALRLWVVRHGVIPAGRGGKAKTVLQVVTLTWYLWPAPASLDPIGVGLITAATVLTVTTGVVYLIGAVRLRYGQGTAVPPRQNL
ncbi:CDP-diacylglycerol--glycerol-3-phosphate 3-phosphatidyltransferase [Actinoplanes sp. TRM 88003]|uniref:CDP-diacylglycerol--glycerol-3-phosphate 3-phosphatidyltransferase n=1 Tax=Paractinoplanes aksuensis TaxID=2939490 RepID=A0ABT1DX87_9ACTN|nr:CDP-diacylglycerol--glycerol-3-phosphate 3-phosphatidyltransferase [Actinoplanes aksuensis]MCO8275478.1 CDP-diacylglycerol--glycerol-3-phosphate 3-phosphatidyltransferase [Actinoplanes aksuensis]